MVNKEVIEFGNAMITTTTGVPDEFALELIQKEIDRHTMVLGYISDLEWLDVPAPVKAPNTDILRRWQPWGWYARFASNGYGELKRHFGCKREHIPERITLRWALRLWWQHRKDWR